MSENKPTPPKPLQQLDYEDWTARIVRQKIWKRLNLDDEHFMGAVVGREGYGKSHTALSIARAVDDGFTAEDVYFSPKKLLEAFDSDDYGAGDMIVLDEAGVGLGNRSWYEKEQILLNQTLQTVRDDNMGVLFTLPRLEEFDSQTIGRLHAFIEMTDVKKDEGHALGKWKNISLSRDGRGKTYKKYPMMRGEDGYDWQVRCVTIGKPPEDLAAAYEERKEEFKEELYERAIEAYEGDSSEESRPPKKVAEDIIEDGASDYISEHGRNGMLYVDKDIIRVEHDLSHRDAAAVKKLVEKQVDLTDDSR
ncbi:hypothetical protein ACOJIV_20630 [Haloarcula sp. AONF1]